MELQAADAAHTSKELAATMDRLGMVQSSVPLTEEAPASVVSAEQTSAENPVERDRKSLGVEQFMYRHGTHEMNADQVHQLLDSSLAVKLSSITRALVGDNYTFTSLNDSEKKDIAERVVNDPSFAWDVVRGEIDSKYVKRLGALLGREMPLAQVVRPTLETVRTREGLEQIIRALDSNDGTGTFKSDSGISLDIERTIKSITDGYGGNVSDGAIQRAVRRLGIG